MITVQCVLWWAVLLCCHASTCTSHALAAADHHAINGLYTSLVFRNSTTSTQSEQSASTPPLGFPDRTSISSWVISWVSSVEDVALATLTGIQGAITTTVAQDSDASAYEDSHIANLTFGRTPLAAPSASILASQANPTNFVYPALSSDTSGNATRIRTATIGQCSTSSTVTPVSNTNELTSTEDLCTVTGAHGPFVTIIEYSIIYTWTITWPGNPADYTPPFPTISLPKPCSPTTSATGAAIVSGCSGSGSSSQLCAPAPPSRTDPWWVWVTDTSAVRGMAPTLTFITTDKNPAVVFPTSLPPDYGGKPDPMGNVHSAANPYEESTLPDAPNYGGGATMTGGQEVKSRPINTDSPLPLPVTVVVKPSVVVIDDHTFTNHPEPSTSTVVVGGNTFTIDPTQVVGVGATITRTPTTNTAGSPVAPTKTTIGDVEIDVEGSRVVIDKTPFTIGPGRTTAVVRGQTITIGSGAIALPDRTLIIPTTAEATATQDTTRVVVGAELITAVGSDKVVIGGRTTTYGPGSSTTTRILDGATIIIGPSGMIVDGKTYGGVKAAATDVQLAVVGGVTISQVGPTVVVVQGVTYTLDDPLTTPAATTVAVAAAAMTRPISTTLVLGGETITIGPSGVTIASWTLTPPPHAYASTTIITPKNDGAAAATAINANNRGNGSGPSSASRLGYWVLLGICLAATTSIVGM